jgi:four helix bundle protein
MQDFTKLKVWEKAHAVAMEVYRLSGEFPRRDGIALTSQLRRAALSVPANIAEGAGKTSASEFSRYLEIALGSASETQYHLLVAKDTGLLKPEAYDNLSLRVVEVRRMLSGLIKRVRSREPALTPSIPMQP